MNTCKQCIHATFGGYCDRKQAWTILNAPACNIFETHPREDVLLNADAAIRAKEKELAALHGDACDLMDALQELFECLEAHHEAFLPPGGYAVDLWRQKLTRMKVLGDAE